MKKIKSKSKKVNMLSTNSFTDKLIYLAVILLSILVIVQGYFLIQLWNKENNSRMTDIKQSFLNSADTLYFLGQNNVDYQYDNSRVAIPGQKLYLPVDSKFLGMSVYQTNDGADGSTAMLYITNELAYLEGQKDINPSYPGASNFLENTDKIQSCTLLVQLYVGEMKDASIQDVSVEKVFNKTTSDGRKVTAFIDSQDTCPYNADAFVEYLKQIDSY